MGKQALNGRRFTGFFMDVNDLKIIGIDTDDGPEHHLYDERILLELDEKFVLNIQTVGVLEPVMVTKIDNVPYIVDGRQRVRAVRIANEKLAAAGNELLTVPCIVKKGEEHELFGMGITANENRRDDSVWTKATKALRYINMGRDEAECAIHFGVSTRTIRNWLVLFDLDRSVQNAVRDGALPPSRAFKMGSLSHEEQKAELVAYAAPQSAPDVQIVTVNGTDTPEGADGAEGADGDASQQSADSADPVVPPSTPAANSSRTPTGRPAAPGRSMIRRNVEAGTELGKHAIDPTQLAILKWTLGETDIDSVPQVKRIFDELEAERLSLEAEKEAKKEAKAARAEARAAKKAETQAKKDKRRAEIDAKLSESGGDASLSAGA